MPTRVCIIAHEGGELPLVETLVDMLTQLFLCLNTSLETDILVDNVAYFDEKANKYHEQLKLVDQPNYKKIQVDRTEFIKNIDAELIIMLAHGESPSTSTDTPASLRFGCPLSDAGRGHSGLRVWANETTLVRKDDHTMLHDVIRNSKIVIMLACAGDEILQDYLKYLSNLPSKLLKHDRYPDYPDIVIFEDEVAIVTVDIFTILFMNLLDSQIDTLPANNLHKDVKTVILRIMQIVQLYGDDHDAFWSFLMQVGCITLEAQEKRNQQLRFPVRRPRDCFRVYGRVYPYSLGTCPRVILTEFKRLKLITRGENGDLQYTTSANVDPIQLTDDSSGITYVDQTLKRRKEYNAHLARQQQVPTQQHDLRLLLLRLKHAAY